ncbi:MAG: hypothetical protein KAY37_10025 [Phycisphaerae bacterium]|nr:hypothetical protein [Phycisphaerae bacterium]
MKRTRNWLNSGLLLCLLATALPAPAEGIDDFKLTRAVPADAMLVMHARDHAGKEFLNQQFERVWAAVEKQHFEKDFKRLLKNTITNQGGDVEAFDAHWQQIMDLAAGVEWSRLGERESAFALKLAPPSGADLIMLMMPPKDQVAESFEGLTAMLKNLVALDEQDRLLLTHEGAGSSVVHKLSFADMPIPLSLTLARHEDVLLIGFGSSMPEQALALLRGESDPEMASLASTDRFKQALAQLPPPTDELFYIDLARLVQQVKVFAKMASRISATQPAEADPSLPPTGPYAFLEPLVEALDLWDYLAGVSSTDGMKTVREEITVLRPGAKTRPFGKVLYGGAPAAEPLKYIPIEATSVSLRGGMDFPALYEAIINFIETEVGGGQEIIAAWNEQRQEFPLDIEEDLLSWIGGEYVTFTAPIPTPFLPGSVLILKVRDEEKAQAALDLVSELLVELLASQGLAVNDAKLEGVEGFKQVVPPSFLMLIPGIGKPIFGVKDGHLFVANGPEVLALALAVAAGEHESFAKNERYLNEGLPLGNNVTGFTFQDLSKWGEKLSQGLSMAGLLPMAAPELMKNPVVNAAVFMVSKFGRVAKELNFYRSHCSVTTFDDNVAHTKRVIHYQQPPPKKKPRPTSAESADEDEGAPAEQESKG